MREARVPTRVSSACDRCRRYKQRCDDFRPCSNCIHARTDCTKSDPLPSTKKTPISKRGRSDGLNATARSCARPPKSGPDSWEECNEHSTQQNSCQYQSRDLDEPSCEQRDSEGRHHEFAVLSERSEQSVFADLRGSDSAIDITKKILDYAGSPSAADRATFAIPGGDSYRTPSSNLVSRKLLPISHVLGVDLPPRHLCDALINTYFYAVHWFSLVIHEPKFRARYVNVMENGVADSSDRPFLLLLLMILVMGCWYGPGVLSDDIYPPSNLAHMRNAFLKVISQSFMDLIDEDCLEFVQLSSLLGSYWLYWGRPRSSFSILGAATKSSHALGLHRESHKRLSSEDAEERKRVWWTVYTWDRFATIIFGRPLGINDKDCNIAMPMPYPENVNFRSGDEQEQICLSMYQIQLNRVYQIASPILENIYGIRHSTDARLRSQMPTMISKVDELLRAWQQDLPQHLDLNKSEDVTLTASSRVKMHGLQALSLQLTYDNLMIVIHRPLLADQSHWRFNARHEDAGQSQSAGNTNVTDEISFQRSLDSALRISRVQHSKRNLLALARRTHLVSFLGINLFTSSVVLFICALSDTLSDVAQEAKRGMARNLKLLKLLSGDGSLSMQCSAILEDLVQLIVDKEKEEMLRSLPTDDDVALFVQSRRGSILREQNESLDIWPGSQAIPEAKAVQERLRGNENPSGGSESVLRQTMATLQKVFKDVTTPKAHPLPATAVQDESNGPYLHSETEHQYQWGENTQEQSAFRFDGSHFHAEDLGQFWLWNMDPYTEDMASWDSGNELPWTYDSQSGDPV